MNHRISGLLDPLINAMKPPRALTLAKACKVSRNSVWAWQKNPRIITFENRLALQYLARVHGVANKLRWLWDPALLDSMEIKKNSTPSSSVSRGHLEAKKEIATRR